ncbi:hypothetical protein Btru_045613 [Bulinus truncatus]|nr:hypothetical protein Btru_045613 [Bulinus truncatus]
MTTVMEKTTPEIITFRSHNESAISPDDVEEKNVPFQMFIAVVSVAGALFICFGNMMTLLAIFQNDRLQTTPNLCIGSLAVADFLVGLMLFVQGAAGFSPSENFVDHNQYLCLSLMSLLFVSVTASMFSTVLVAADRFVYIVYSFLYPTLVTRTRSAILMTAVWIIALIYGSIPMYTSHYEQTEGCEPTHAFSKTYMIIVHPTLFFAICFVTLGLYVGVGRTALKQRRQIKAQKDNVGSADQTRVTRRSWRLVKLLMAVFGFFFISWCPLLIVSILEYTVHVSHQALTVSALLAVMNSGINFLVLCFMNADFRNEFRKILCSQCGHHKIYPAPVSTISGSMPD